MNRLVRLASACCLMLAFSLTAIAQKAVIMQNNGKALSVDAVTADASGNLTYSDGPVKGQRMPVGTYRWVRTPKPREIETAEQLARTNKYAEAAAQARELYGKFKFVGWDAHLLYLEGMSLTRINKDAEAIPRLELLSGVKVTDLDPEKDKIARFYECRKLLAEIYVRNSKWDEANQILNQLLASQDDNLVAFALNARGEILHRQNKKRDAALMFLRIVLLFPKENKERPKALLNVANLLKEMNDNRASTFAERLRQDYPDSAMIKDLK